MAKTDDKRKRAGARERSDDEQVDLLGISRRDKRLHGSVYALIILVWVGIVAWNTIESDCWSSQQPRTSCIIDAVGSIDKAVFPALMLTIALIASGRSGRAAFRRTLMVLPVLRDTYAENLQAAEARGREIGVDIGAEKEKLRLKNGMSVSSAPKRTASRSTNRRRGKSNNAAQDAASIGADRLTFPSMRPSASTPADACAPHAAPTRAITHETTCQTLKTG